MKNVKKLSAFTLALCLSVLGLNAQNIATTSTTPSTETGVKKEAKNKTHKKAKAHSEVATTTATPSTDLPKVKKAKSKKVKGLKATSEKNPSVSQTPTGATTEVAKTETPISAIEPVTKVKTKARKTKAQKTETIPNVNAGSETASTQTKTMKTKRANTTKTDVADQVIGQDAKGRALHKGPRGGVYYLTEKGNKEYVKQK
jgi:hypothetical protein